MSTEKQYSFTLMQRVLLVEASDKKATIQQIIFAVDGVQYQVAYWADGIRRVDWVFAHEIAPMQNSSKVIS